MSVSQVQGILGRALTTQPDLRKHPEPSLYFAYGNHLHYVEFKIKHPGAKVLGIGFLKDWTWHINSRGVANIRPSPITHEGVIIKGPAAFPTPGDGTFEWDSPGTYGTVFLISPEMEDRIDRAHAASRVKLCQGVKVITSRPGILPVVQTLNCIFHYDARNTSDGCRDMWAMNSVEDSLWLDSLAGFRKSGVPDWYLARVNKHLSGLHGDAEPFCMNMAEMKPGYVCPYPIPAQRSYRVQKHATSQSRQAGSGHTANKNRPDLRTEHCARPAPQQGPTAHPRGPSASVSRPIRRQEAVLVEPDMFTWYPQVHPAPGAAAP